MPIGLIQVMVGHISARTVRHCTHITSGAARKAVALLDSEPIPRQNASTKAREVEVEDKKPRSAANAELTAKSSVGFFVGFLVFGSPRGL